MDADVPDAARRVLPAGGLVVPVDCRTSAAGEPTPHEVRITDSWELRTPHDLDAERIGVALGGVCTCVDLADRTLPAVRGYLTHRLRTEPAAIVHRRDASWRPRTDVVGCCREQGFPQARDAAAHLRRPRHWAQRFGAEPRDVADLAQRILDALAAGSGAPVLAEQSGDPPCPPPPPGGAGELTDASGWRTLWDAGLAPDVVAEVCHEAAAAGESVAVRDVLEQVYGEAAARPGGQDARRRRRVDRRHLPGERRDWAAAGVAPGVITALLSEDAYSLGDARIFGARLGRSVGEAAGVLARWQAVGLTPSVDTLVGVYWGPMLLDVPPARALVEQTLALAEAAGVQASRLEAALALIRSGGPAAAVAYLTDPIRRPDDPYSP